MGSMRSHIVLYAESVVALSCWRVNIKSPITTRHCSPRKSFVRRELRADSGEKLGRKFSPILRISLACPSSVHSQFRRYSNKQLPPRDRSYDIAVFSPRELFNNISKKLAPSPHPISSLSFSLFLIPSSPARFTYTISFFSPSLTIERKAEYFL